MPTHYETLEVDPSATPETIRAAYVGLIKRHHGDAGGKARMDQITAAYDALKDPQRRAAYDAALTRSSSGGSSSSSSGGGTWQSRQEEPVGFETEPPPRRPPPGGPAPAATPGIADAQVRQLIGYAVGGIAGHVCSLVLFVLIFPPVLSVLSLIVAFYPAAFAFLVSLGVGFGTGYVAWSAGLIAAERIYYGEEYTFATRQAVLVRATVTGLVLNPDIILFIFLGLCAIRLVFIAGQPNSFSAQVGTAAGALLAHRNLVLRWS